MVYLAIHAAVAGDARAGPSRQLTSGEASYVAPGRRRETARSSWAALHLASDIWKFPTDGPPHDQRAERGAHHDQTGHVLTPTPGPGDREIAFLSDRGGHANLWVIDVEQRCPSADYP